MRIIFLTPEYPRQNKPEGGLANYIKNIAGKAIKYGYEVEVIVVNDQKKRWNDGGVLINEYKKVVISRFLKSIPFFYQIFAFIETIANSFLVTVILRKNWSKSHFDIVQVSNYQLYGLFLPKKRCYGVITRLSSSSILYKRGLKISWYDKLMEAMEIKQLNNSDCVISPSKLVASYFANKGIQDIRIVKTPVSDANKIRWNKSLYKTYLEKKKYLLYFGRLNEIKGFDLVVDMLPKLLSKYKDLSMMVVGSDEGDNNGRGYVGSLTDLNEKYFGRVIYFETVAKELLFPLIASSIGVLMPSRKDNYPNACLESLSLHAPIVCSSNSSVDEIVIDGKTGFIFENSSSTDLFKKVEMLLNLSAVKKKRLVRNIKKFVAKEMELKRETQLFRVYNDTLSKLKK